MPHAEDARDPRIARHVAVIMDGNGRWAEGRGLPRIRGHETGVESVRAVTRHAAGLGLAQLTLFAFSTENWKRPEDEVAFLMDLLAHYLAEERGELMENRIRLRAIGRLERLPAHVRRALDETLRLTAANDGMVLCLALNYGARAEIADAAHRLAADAAEGRIDLECLGPGGVEAALAARTYQPDMPALDLLVRTAGEQRLSNFLLWQAAYAELWITDLCWPDFREAELETALAAFGGRVRRFGGLVVGEAS